MKLELEAVEIYPEITISTKGALLTFRLCITQLLREFEEGFYAPPHPVKNLICVYFPKNFPEMPPLKIIHKCVISRITRIQSHSGGNYLELKRLNGRMEQESSNKLIEVDIDKKTIFP